VRFYTFGQFFFWARFLASFYVGHTTDLVNAIYTWNSESHSFSFVYNFFIDPNLLWIRLLYFSFQCKKCCKSKEGIFRMGPSIRYLVVRYYLYSINLSLEFIWFHSSIYGELAGPILILFGILQS